MFKLLKLGIVLFYIVTFVAFVVFILWFEVGGIIFSISPLVYWFMVIGWLLLVLNAHLKSVTTLRMSMAMFILGTVMTIVGLRQSGISEVILRTAFLGFILGIIQALWEYRRGD